MLTLLIVLESDEPFDLLVDGSRYDRIILNPTSFKTMTFSLSCRVYLLKLNLCLLFYIYDSLLLETKAIRAMFLVVSRCAPN